MKEKTKSWMEFARRDLLAAEQLSEDETFSTITLFHCQQCIEKSLKALFEENDLKIPRIHTTLKLFANIRNTIPAISSLVEIDDLNFIDTVYIDTRYPGDIGLLPSGFPTKKEVSRGLSLARKIYEGVEEAIP